MQSHRRNKSVKSRRKLCGYIKKNLYTVWM